MKLYYLKSDNHRPCQALSLLKLVVQCGEAPRKTLHFRKYFKGLKDDSFVTVATQ